MPNAPKIKHMPFNWSTDRKGQRIVAIVAHNTVGSDSRAYLSRGGDAPDGSDRMVSIHSLIQRDGMLYRYVPDERGANHAGFGKMPPGFPQVNPNLCTIGFELENRSDGRSLVEQYTESQLLTMGWEINRIRAKFGPLPIIRHATLDPDRRRDTAGLSVEDMEKWAHAAPLVFGEDPWAAWGPIGKPEGDAQSFSIPRAWLMNKALGACVRAEEYLTPALSIAVFEHGFIYFNVATKAAKVEMF